MEDVERRRFEMFVRVRDFGAAHASSFPAASRGRELFTKVNRVVEELTTHAAAQSSGAGAHGTASRAAAREELCDDLEAISRTARAVFSASPGLQERFRQPRDKRNDQQLIAAARAFATDATPLRAELIRNELPANFIEHLNADIEAFEASITNQNRCREARISVVESIDAAIDRGVEAVRQLDAIVRNKFRDDPATLAAWTCASYTERVRHHTPQPHAATQSTPDLKTRSMGGKR